MIKKISLICLATIFIVSSVFSFSAPALASSYNGKLVKMEGMDAVYYVASDGGRYVFPNSNTFKTWFSNFNGVVTLSPSEIQTIPLKGNVVYRPGVALIKITTDPKIYAVGKDGTLRWIATESIARALYGEGWSKLVDDVPDSFFVNYQIGNPINDVSDFNPDQELSNVDSIESNKNLAVGNARRADTGRCVFANNVRSCKASPGSGNNNGNNNDDNSNDDNNSGNNNDSTIGISSIEVVNGGEDGYIDVDDYILIKFNQPINPLSVDSNLKKGRYINYVEYFETGGINISSGEITINGIVTFYPKSIAGSGTFLTRVALNDAGDTLTITLVSGSAIKIFDEGFIGTSQVGGAIEDVSGKKMVVKAKISNPIGTFGKVLEEKDGPDISSVQVVNGGSDGYIDINDIIIITFSEAIDPASIHSSLSAGGSVVDITYSKNGGVEVDSAGKMTIKNIASFDMGSVKNSGTFTSKLSLNSSGRVLTIILTGGEEIRIDKESFDNANQLGGVVEDLEEDEMESKSSVKPTGTFGGAYGVNVDDDGFAPKIKSIQIANGGNANYIDANDAITITFSEPIDPESVHASLKAGEFINGVQYSKTGGASIFLTGLMVIEGIVKFDVGTVANSGIFVSKIALNTTGDVLTITLSGSSVQITNKAFTETVQIGEIIEDKSGNEMNSNSNIASPTGSF